MNVDEDRREERGVRGSNGRGPNLNIMLVKRGKLGRKRRRKLKKRRRKR